MMSTNQEASDDENRSDFELLRGQLSSILATGRRADASSNLWPLRLKAVLVDHYIFGDTIGNGSYAEVRECIDTNTLRRCAVKIIDKNYLRRQAPRALANQMQEIRLLRMLEHPNVISLIECRLKGPKVYIFLEYCTFVLHDLLQEQTDGRFHCSQMIRNLFEQLATGLAYLHSVGIVHRDIKPQNILIDHCGTLKLIDFGVSQVLSMWLRTDLCSHNEGSPLFQAPEVVSISGQTEQYAGFKVDVWSAGVTLYLMLFGRYPFEDEALLGLYDKILSQQLSFPNGIEIPSKLVACDLLSTMLEKDHSKRANIEQVLEHPWIRLNHSANHTEASLYDQRHSEFLELTQRRRYLARMNSGAPSKARDVYESMSVIPYLHNYHFPQAKVLRASSSQQQKGAFELSRATTSTTASDPHEIISHDDDDGHDDSDAVEWGTIEQYNLLKVPSVRANRLNPLSRPSRPR